MTLGDGIRRDIATVSDFERDRFIAAIVKLDTIKFFPDGVTYWDKQEDIHKNAHFHGVDVHAGPAFIPWHRVIVNRLEELLREVDPELSLHYWDWTTDPRVASAGRTALFTPAFMGNANGDAGHLLNNFESTEGGGHNKIWRQVGAVAANPDGTPAIASDASILGAGDFASLATALKTAHDNVAHSYIGGTITQPHYSFHDPFVFLLHSNLDRIWAKWQTAPGTPARFASGTAYAGFSPGDITTLATDNVEPWAGGTGLEPWASDPTRRAVVTYTDVSVVTPPCYDTNDSSFEVYEPENPRNVATSRYQISFNDVPEDERTWRAAVLRVRSCDEVTLRVKPGTEPAAPFSVVSSSVPVHHGPTAVAEARIWFEFGAGALGTAPQTLGPVNTTITDDQGHDFDFELRANTIHRPTVAVQFALDQSGSMAWPAGTSGTTRLQVLKDAASLFASLIQRNNGLGIIRFDQDAYPPNDPTFGGMPITRINSDSFGDPARGTALGVIAAHSANGNTSVGDGLLMARSQLAALPAGSYDDQAIIVLTDGLENEPQSIAAASGAIDTRTFAVGLGNEAQVNTQALTAIAGSTGGFLLLSGLLSASLDDQFRLRKFFLQILAGVTKTSIVRDPTGYVMAGAPVRVPFELNEADINCRAILLTEWPFVRLSIEAPDGSLIDESSGAAAGVAFEASSAVRTASFTLPIAIGGAVPAQAGTWHAILEIDEKLLRRFQGGERVLTHVEDRETWSQELVGRGAKYCLSVHAYSNLRMQVAVGQSGFQPGATVSLSTRLTEYGQPVAGRARVVVDADAPDGSRFTVALPETAPGTFSNSFVASQAGIYRLTLRASGGTFRGAAFTREQIATAAVWPGGDRPLPEPTTPGGTPWCDLLECLLDDERLQERLKEQGIDPDHLRRCLEKVCK